MYNWLKRHLIPHSGNDYRPHLLEQVAMGGLLCLVLLSFAVANVQSLLWISSDWLVSTILPAVIVAETNEEREDDELTPLVRSQALDRAAQMKAEHMAKEEYFSHYSPDGTSPWFWFTQADYDYLHAGENLAIHFTDSHDVVEAWMDSPTHRANIMNGDYREIGIGTAKGEYEGYPTIYVVQLFGTPRERTIAASDRLSRNQASTEAVAVAEAPVTTDAGTVLAAEDGEESEVTEVPVEQNNLAVETPPEPSPEPDQATVANEEVDAGVEDLEVNESTSSPTLVPREEVATVSTQSTSSVPTTTPAKVDSELVPTLPDTVLVLDHLSTSTPGIAASIEGEPASSEPPTLAIATQPHTLLQFLYICIGVLVTFTLVLSVFIEIRRQHPLHVVYSAGMMGLMVVLLYVHLILSKGALIA